MGDAHFSPLVVRFTSYTLLLVPSFVRPENTPSKASNLGRDRAPLASLERNSAQWHLLFCF